MLTIFVAACGIIPTEQIGILFQNNATNEKKALEIGRALDLTDERKQYQQNYVPQTKRGLFGMVQEQTKTS